MDLITRISQQFTDSAQTKLNATELLAAPIAEAAEAMTACLLANGKILACGNGGSAGDAQHFVAELVGRFERERQSLAAVALSTDTSILTAVGNDYGFERVFSKQVQALGRPEDLALGISTSGTSANVVKGMQAAREIGMRTAALTGGTVRPGGDLAALCDLVLNVPADSTPHIQETHLWIEHVLCEIVEKQLFGSA